MNIEVGKTLKRGNDRVIRNEEGVLPIGVIVK